MRYEQISWTKNRFHACHEFPEKTSHFGIIHFQQTCRRWKKNWSSHLLWWEKHCLQMRKIQNVFCSVSFLWVRFPLFCLLQRYFRKQASIFVEKENEHTCSQYIDINFAIFVKVHTTNADHVQFETRLNELIFVLLLGLHPVNAYIRCPRRTATWEDISFSASKQLWFRAVVLFHPRHECPNHCKKKKRHKRVAFMAWNLWKASGLLYLEIFDWKRVLMRYLQLRGAVNI